MKEILGQARLQVQTPTGEMVQGLGLGAQGLGFRDYAGFRVWALRFRGFGWYVD